MKGKSWCGGIRAQASASAALFLPLFACVGEATSPSGDLVPVRASAVASTSCSPTGGGLAEHRLDAPPEVRAGPGVAVADFDADGLLDLFVPYHRANQLWLGTRGDRKSVV